MRVGLKVVQNFRQGRLPNGKPAEYQVGTFVPDEHHETWPAETLATRLQNGFVKWEGIEEDEAGGSITLADLDKAGLILYAEQRHGMKLDARQTETTLRQQIDAAEQRRQLMATRDAAKTVARTPAGKVSSFGPRAPKATPGSEATGSVVHIPAPVAVTGNIAPVATGDAGTPGTPIINSGEGGTPPVVDPGVVGDGEKAAGTGGVDETPASPGAGT